MTRILAMLALLATPGDGVSWRQFVCGLAPPEVGVDMSAPEVALWMEKCRKEKIRNWIDYCRSRDGFVAWKMDGKGEITEYRCEQLCRCEKVGP